jgi:transcriptional regulator with XRE-family HTH domain
MNTIGSKIRDLRVKKGFSQQNFAQELGISQPSYARLEQDDSRITITRLISIASLLDINASKLLDDNFITTKNPKKSLKENNPYYDIIDEFNKEQIVLLKDEITFLRGIISSLSSSKGSLWIN